MRRARRLLLAALAGAVLATSCSIETKDFDALFGEDFSVAALETAQSSRVFDRNGNLIVELRGEQNRTDVSIDDLAAASGVSARTLYKGFQEFRGVSPMKFLKLTRLEMVHRELLHAEPSDSVTRIAMDYGFRQLGRFAVEYRQRFGESPSDTLRHAPGSHAAGHVQ